MTREQKAEREYLAGKLREMSETIVRLETENKVLKLRLREKENIL